MIVPNKAVSYEASILSKLPTILRVLKIEKVSPAALYHRTQTEFADINQFLLAIDTLFVLEKIEFENGDLRLC